MNDEELGRKRLAAAARGREAAGLGRGGRGKALDPVPRALGVTAAPLPAWREAFLAAGEAALATRPATGEAIESQRLKAKLGEVLIERDLLAEKIALLEAGRPLARRRSRP